ncbi:ATPase [uncultured Endozoicomonas sp.]|uniref:ATPase n=1 Tax=uncultured Endozoicomonas sp. TaxID=432652 RepID=UPI0026360ED9|nr:ATPase [uncultured Endozoicomonas sp.]
MSIATPEGKTVSVGVQELIEKLRNQGVDSGRQEASKIVAGAEARAAELIADAEKRASAIVGKAREEAGFITKAGTEALQLAERNAILELKDYLLKTFSNQIRAVVSHSMEGDQLLEKMIVEVAGQNNLHGEQNIEVILPRKVIGVDELRDNPELLKAGGLLEFAMKRASDMLENGVTFTTGGVSQTGISFRLKDKDIQVELTDEAVAEVLLKHLQPRFRALLEGIIK